jgi:outer membrane receptor protein involved in Fe transport
MSKRLRGFAAVVGLLLCAEARPDGAGAGTISGVALDTASGRPLVGAIVQLTGPTLDGPRTVLSEDGGKFTLGDLPAGSYALSVKLDGYQPFQRAEVAVEEGETARVGAWLAPEGMEGEDVVVTGSRIRRKDVTSAAPVTIIDRQQIDQSGLLGLGEFLQRLPEQVGAVNAQMNNGNQGQVEFSLRGLHSRRTLVLVNGRRWIGHNGETMVDLNTIPLAAVERIEVMKDGASAIYGSDAIAGVVNIILKRKFDGTQVSAQGGVSSRGDAESYDLSGSTGLTGERGSVFFSASYQDQRPISALDRRWSQSGLVYDFRSRSVGKDTSFYTPAGSITINDAVEVCAAPASIANPVLRQACQQYQADGTTDFIYDKRTGTYRPLTSADRFNYQEGTFLLTPARRLQLFTTGNLQLGEEVRGFYEASFAHRSSRRRFPSSLEDLTIPGDNPYNDLGTEVAVAKRTVEAGLRRYAEEVNTYRLALGLEGEVGAWAGVLQGWHWGASYVLGRSTLRDTTDGQLQEQAFQDSSTCGTASATPGCVPFDVMHGATTFTPDQRSAFTYSGIAHGYQEQHVLSVDVSGKLIELWANRPAGLAAGVELRRESGGYFPDPVAAAGRASEGNQSAVSGSYSSRELYAELSLPLVGQRPLVEDLELTAALRNVDYSSFGKNTSYKLGGRWMPVRDVTLRGTWSTAFRAPGILELYTGDAEAYRPGTDPCIAPGASEAVAQQCRAEPGVPGGLLPPYGDSQVRAMEGGNPGLRPETATTVTAGLVLQPRWVRSLSFTVDYWDIHLDHAIDTVGASTILDRCYTGEGAGNVYCQKIHRDPTTGRITQVDDRFTNLGTSRTSGVDVAGRYALPTRVAGTFRVSVDATYLIRYDRTLSDGTTIHSAGNYDLQLLLPRWKWNAGLDWRYGPFGVTTDARFIGSFRECGAGDGTSYGGSCAAHPEFSRRVRSNVVFDLAGTYELKTALGTTGVALGVRNVFDSAPPMIFDAASNNTDPGYDFEGRYVWARLTQAF